MVFLYKKENLLKSFEKNWEIPILGKILKQIVLFLKYKLLFHCNILSKAVALSVFPSDNLFLIDCGMRICVLFVCVTCQLTVLY